MQNDPAHASLSCAVSLLRTAAQRVLEADGASDLRSSSRKDRMMADTVRVEIGDALASLK